MDHKALMQAAQFMKPGGYHKNVEDCRKKQTYTSHAEAKRLVKNIPGKKLRPYKCPHCGLYHLTRGKK